MATLPVLPDLEFDEFETIQVPVKIGKNKYWLREADGFAAAKFKGAQASAVRIEEGKVSGMTGATSQAELELVGDCLFRDKDNTPVNISIYGKWPHRILKPIIEAAKALSGLETKETKEQLLKQKQKIEDKLKLLAVGGPDTDPKELPSDTKSGSLSPTDSESSVLIASSDEFLIGSLPPGTSGSN